MINNKMFKPIVAVTVVLAILLVAMAFFNNDSDKYSCSGQQKIHMKPGEYMDLWVKINIQKQKASMIVKGFYHHADGSQKKIYQQGNYQYNHFYNELFEAKLQSVQRMFKDQSPEPLSNYIFGIEPGESRNFRARKVRDGLMMFGSEYVWFYACKMDA